MAPRSVAVCFWSLATLGLVGAVALVLCAAPLQAEGSRRLLGPWGAWAWQWGAWRREPTAFGHGGLLVVAAVLLLLSAWLLTAQVVIRCGVSTSRLVLVSALWSIPFAVAPPILSRDAYAYLAQGAVARSNPNPYRSPSLALHVASPFLHAMDPLYRNRVSPYGPLAVRLFEGCVTLAHDNGVVALVVLRVLVLFSLWFTVWCGCQLASPGRKSLTVWLLAANPLMLLDLVGGLHLEAFVVALLAAAFLLRTRWGPVAAALVVTAAAIKVTALIALAALLVEAFRRSGARGLAADLAGTGGAVAVLTMITQPNPYGWVPALSSPLQVWNPISLPTSAAMLWASIAGGSPLPAIAPLRVVGLVAGVVGAAALLLRGRSLSPVATAGYLLAVLTLSGPVLWPWYLVPAMVLLVVGGSSRQIALGLGLSAGAALSNLPMPVVQMQRVSAVSAVCVAGLLAYSVLRFRLRAPTRTMWQRSRRP